MHTAGQKWMKKSSIFARLKELCLGILFPQRCPVCDGILGPEYIGIGRVHDDCNGKLLPTGDCVCMHCGRPVKAGQEYCYDCSRKDLTESFEQGKSLFLYRGPVRKTMYRFKYSNKREYALFFAEETWRVYRKWIEQKRIEVIVPVPMYVPKQRRRGYNQAECFAKALSKQSGLPVASGWVERIRDTAPQKELDDIQRKNNLKSAFHCEKNIVQYNRVLLVDDIYTTGSTADAVVEELKKNGVAEVYFLSICIGEGM